VLRPRDCEHLVLYLKDINLPKPDKWGTSQTIAFLQQVGCVLSNQLTVQCILYRRQLVEGRSLKCTPCRDGSEFCELLLPSPQFFQRFVSLLEMINKHPKQKKIIRFLPIAQELTPIAQDLTYRL